MRDPDVKHQLARLNRQAWSLVPPELRPLGRATTPAGPDPRRGAVAGRPLRGGPGRRGGLPPGLPAPLPATAVAAYYGSIFPAVQNLLLAARAIGLGATLTTLPLWSLTLARRTLGLPSRVHPVAVIPLGWPKGGYGPTTRRPVEAITHLDHYGNRALHLRCTREQWKVRNNEAHDGLSGTRTRNRELWIRAPSRGFSPMGVPHEAEPARGR